MLLGTAKRNSGSWRTRSPPRGVSLSALSAMKKRRLPSTLVLHSTLSVPSAGAINWIFLPCPSPLSLPSRPSLNACGVCRIPYQQEHAMLRHRWLLEASAAVLNLTILPCNWRILRKCSPRYAEKDHQQLVELRSQRDALQEKLVSGDRAQVDGEQIQVRAQVYQEERSIVPEEVKVLTEGIDF